MFLAARGKYMELVMGRRAAEDDEHTEVSYLKPYPEACDDMTNPFKTDGSDADGEEPQYLYRIGKRGIKEVERGFVPEAVREPDGAAAHERGRIEWDDFIKRARLGEDLNPQMEALDSTVDAATQDRVDRSIESLLHATQVIQQQDAADGTDLDPSPRALSLLADIALEPPQALQPPLRTDPNAHSHRSILSISSQGPPHGMAPGPTEPRSFLLPRPSPILSQARQPLPGRGELGLPDPFGMSGIPQLPPPPGSNFRSLPLPGYQFPGPPGPPGPPPPGPPGPPSLYFPSPHGPGHPPRRY